MRSPSGCRLKCAPAATGAARQRIRVANKTKLIEREQHDAFKTRSCRHAHFAQPRGSGIADRDEMTSLRWSKALRRTKVDCLESFVQIACQCESDRLRLKYRERRGRPRRRIVDRLIEDRLI